MSKAELGSLFRKAAFALSLGAICLGCTIEAVSNVTSGSEAGVTDGSEVFDGPATDGSNPLIDAPAGTGDGGGADGACSGTGPATKLVSGKACSCGNQCDSGACVLGICCKGNTCIKRPLSAVCDKATDCASGFCADGICCNLACTGGCLSCNQPTKMGECFPTPAGAPDSHGLCRRDPAETCGESGLCNGLGGCAKHAAGTVCRVPSCNGGRDLIPPSSCDGAGVCLQATAVDCAPFTCDQGACRVTCDSSTQCAAPATCNNGSCGKRGKGQSCTLAAQCLSNFCVDGVCCDGACEGKCSFCALSNSRGSCVAVGDGLPDPRVAAGVTDAARICADQGPGSCGTNGLCDGKSGCQSYAEGTVCRSGSCDAASNLETGAAVCSGGSCQAGGSRSCAPYLGCTGSRCSTFCTSDGQCSNGNVCDANSCGKRPAGSLCSRSEECAAPGICAQGRCCASACNGTCMACNIEGSLGSCRPVPAGGFDPTGTCKEDACTTNCDGAGGCRREATGTTCSPATCASGSTLTVWTCSASGVCQMSSSPCPSGQTCMTNRCAPPAKKVPGEDCVDNADCMSNACVAGKCCNSACSGACNSCTANTAWTCAQAPNNTPCGQGMICTNGICAKKSSGATCTDGIECQSGSCLAGKCCADSCTGACKECTSGKNWACSDRANNSTCGSNLVCTEGNCGPPPKKNDGDLCGTDAECMSNACVGGNCCASACSGVCRQCTAGTGWTCKDRPNGDSCGTKMICASGTCINAPKKVNGDACIDGDECQSMACVGGFCCASACAGTCKQCNAGTAWACANKNDGTSCGVGMVCAQGSCGSVPKKVDGDSCAADDECMSSACVNGKCCAQACSSVCKECTLATGWTCSDKANGTGCGTGFQCTGGACVEIPKKVNGAVCGGDGECMSAACVSGFCCATACAGVCKQCTALTGWTCQGLPEGTACGVDVSCQTGACVPNPKKANGQPCTGNSNCVSNACVDGFCCATACTTGECRQCNATTSWTCKIKTNGTTCTTGKCMGGMCK